MALYDRGDPKVIPEENLLPFVDLLERADIEIRVRSQKRDTHTPKDLLLEHFYTHGRFPSEPLQLELAGANAVEPS